MDIIISPEDRIIRVIAAVSISENNCVSMDDLYAILSEEEDRGTLDETNKGI